MSCTGRHEFTVTSPLSYCGWLYWWMDVSDIWYSDRSSSLHYGSMNSIFHNTVMFSCTWKYTNNRILVILYSNLWQFPRPNFRHRKWLWSNDSLIALCSLWPIFKRSDTCPIYGKTCQLVYLRWCMCVFVNNGTFVLQRNWTFFSRTIRVPLQHCCHCNVHMCNMVRMTNSFNVTCLNLHMGPAFVNCSNGSPSRINKH